MVSISGRDNSSSDDAVSESLSALVDNQGNELDLARVLKAADANAAVRGQWQRYHQISAVMRNDDVAFTGFDISAKVRDALDAEPALKPGAGQSQGSRKWLHVLGKTSIAATVAVGFLIGVQQLNPAVVPGGEDAIAEAEPLIAPDLNSAVVPAGFDAPQLSARTVSTGPNRASSVAPQARVSGVPAQRGEAVIGDPELQAHFDRLLMIHAQEVSANSNFSVMPFARLTDLDALDTTGANRAPAQGSSAAQTQQD